MTENTNPSSTVYGKFSFGAGAILEDPDNIAKPFGDERTLDSYKQSIKIDLAKSDIKEKDLKQWSVLDVGTGYQALALLKLGASKVDHFDLSTQNTQRINTYIKSNNLENSLSSTNADLVTATLEKERYDFIYLNGVAQHLSHVGKGLANCAQALAPHGIFWLYFYRAGTFPNFVVYLLRNLIHGSNEVVTSDDKAYFSAATLWSSSVITPDFFVSSFMDSLFARYIRLYSLDSYLEFLRLMGFEIISTSGMDPMGRSVDHSFARSAVVLTVRKVRKPIDEAHAISILSPEKECDERIIDNNVYPEIAETIRIFEELQKYLEKMDGALNLKAFVAFRIYKWLVEHGLGVDTTGKRHEEFQFILKRCLSITKREQLYDDEYKF